MNTETLTDADKAQAVRDYAAHCNGSQDMHKHWLGLLYTDGMLHLAETCGAHWLIDLVASWQPKIAKKMQRPGLDPGLASFQVWRLRQTKVACKNCGQWAHPSRNGHPDCLNECQARGFAEHETPGWIVDAWSDTPEDSTRLASQALEHSDFPAELAPFEWWVENGTMLLKEER